jgi:hypothetical protein
MRVVLLNPRDEYNVAPAGLFRPDRPASLSVPLGPLTIAAFFPPNCELEFIDENIRPADPEMFRTADLILTGGMYSQRRRCRFWIRELRKLGKVVVVGGPDATEAPIAYREASHLILGEAEEIFPKFLKDYFAGEAGPVYQGSRIENLDDAPIPRFDLVREGQYSRVPIQFGRGCPFMCEFCAIPVTAGRVPRSKSPARILAELDAIRRCSPQLPRRIYVVDDNLISNRVWFRSVMEAVSQYQRDHGQPFIFDGYVSLNIVNDDSLIEALVDAGFRNVFIGVESPDPAVLEDHRKYQNRKHEVAESIRKFHAHGVTVIPGLVVGNDKETPPVAPMLVAMLRDAGTPMFVPTLLFAQPKTPLTARLLKEGRMLCECDRVEEIDEEYVHSGLNFVTNRPRREILKDYAELLRVGYSAREYFARVAQMFAHFGTRAPRESKGTASVSRSQRRKGMIQGIRHLIILFVLEPQCIWPATRVLLTVARERPQWLGLCVEQVVLYRWQRLFAVGRRRNALNALGLFARRRGPALTPWRRLWQRVIPAWLAPAVEAR